jgi:hypothetical protein
MMNATVLPSPSAVHAGLVVSRPQFRLVYSLVFSLRFNPSENNIQRVEEKQLMHHIIDCFRLMLH